MGGARQSGEPVRRRDQSRENGNTQTAAHCCANRMQIMEKTFTVTLSLSFFSGD
jgi:hypothetical protein